jgi:hypothetical protein
LTCSRCAPSALRPRRRRRASACRGCGLFGLHALSDQVGNRHSQGPGQLLDVVDRDVALAALNQADIGAMEFRKVGELLLGNASLRPKQPQVSCQRFPGRVRFLPGPHPGSGCGMMIMDLQTISSFPVASLAGRGVTNRCIERLGMNGTWLFASGTSCAACTPAIQNGCSRYPDDAPPNDFATAAGKRVRREDRSRFSPQVQINVAALTAKPNRR